MLAARVIPRWFVSCLAWTAVGCDCLAPFPASAALRPAAQTNSTTVEIQGKLQAVPASPARMDFRTESGQVYSLVSNQLSMALFADTNLQTKTLLLKGHFEPDPRHFEVTGNLHSLRAGKIYELYYYCDICSIRGIEPGPCMCCREPVHLVEEQKSGVKQP